MSLIKCPECGKKFSDKAEACPKCSCPISEVKKNIKKTEKNNLSKKKEKISFKDKIKKELESIKNSKKKKIVLLSIAITLIVIICTLLFLTVFNENWKNANINFDNAYKIAEKKNIDLEKLISISEELVYSEKTALDENLRPILETSISEAKAAKKDLPGKSLFTKKINEKTVNLNKIDYETVYKKLEQDYNNLDNSIRKYELVYQPTEAYIIERLKTVNHVKNIAAVTEDNDPNGHLNKQGGYTATVYYSDDRINLDKDIYGKTVIEQGTDGGGGIEVYSTVEDAEERRDYLSSYDGGIFANGTHTVVGTVLVRTSNELNATQQKEMEKAIIEALTKLDEEKSLSNSETQNDPDTKESQVETAVTEIQNEPTKVNPPAQEKKIEKVVFNGGTNKTTYTEGEEINFSGKISGFTGKKYITLIQNFPNGESYTDTFDVQSGDNIGFGYVDCGVGNGSFTVKLTDTGEVLGYYEFIIQ